jgi:hypothetical protein
MPLARYFVFIGGVLLALLFISDAFLPKSEVAERAAPLPVIRIHSDRKWPERVVYDTNLPTIVPPQSLSREANILPPTMVTDVSGKTKQREAFAQVRTPESNQPQMSDPRRREQKSQGRYKVAKRHAPRPTVLVARQTPFGWFSNSIW